MDEIQKLIDEKGYNLSQDDLTTINIMLVELPFDEAVEIHPYIMEAISLIVNDSANYKGDIKEF